MGRLAMLGVLALLFTITGLPVLSPAQERAGSTDFRRRSNSSIEDMAQALFPAEPAAVQTRGIGPPQVPPSMLPPRPAVTLNVLFETNADAIPASAHAELDKLGTLLNWPQYTDYLIQLEGHTDSRGSARQNQVLSEKRVQNIQAYLIQHFHIAPERVRAVGYGASRPIASNDTAEGRSQNRRVEVVNLGHAQ